MDTYNIIAKILIQEKKVYVKSIEKKMIYIIMV